MYQHIQSEKYILEEEQQQRNWENEFGGLRDQAFSLMDKCLAHKGRDDIGKLQEFFSNTEIVKALSEVNDFAFMLVAMEIYELELQAKIEKGVFYWADNLSGLIEVIRQVKFLLWKIEFLGDKKAGPMLLKYLSDVNISMPALEYLVYISSCDKNKVVGALNRLFTE